MKGTYIVIVLKDGTRRYFLKNYNQIKAIDSFTSKFDNERELIRTIYGTDDIVKDVQDLYINEFEEARLEYNLSNRNMILSHISGGLCGNVVDNFRELDNNEIDIGDKTP